MRVSKIWSSVAPLSFARTGTLQSFLCGFEQFALAFWRESFGGCIAASFCTAGLRVGTFAWPIGA